MKCNDFALLCYCMSKDRLILLILNNNMNANIRWINHNTRLIPLTFHHLLYRNLPFSSTFFHVILLSFPSFLSILPIFFVFTQLNVSKIDLSVYPWHCNVWNWIKWSYFSLNFCDCLPHWWLIWLSICIFWGTIPSTGCFRSSCWGKHTWFHQTMIRSFRNWQYARSGETSRWSSPKPGNKPYCPFSAN